MKNRLAKIILMIFIVALNISIDQVTKEWARNNVQGQGTIQVVGRLFEMKYAENTGAFLGMGSNIPQPWKTMILVLFPLIVVIVSILYIFLNKKMTTFQIITAACITGGGISNIYDRIFNNGAVTDFLNFGIGNLRTGILNVADMSITFGAILLLISQYLYENREKAKALEAEETDEIENRESE